MEFIKYNDIRIIRSVNRKFPELCHSNPITSRFYENFKEFVLGVVREHDLEVGNLVEQGETALGDRLEALNSVLTIYRLS